jgi:Zn-dependent protease
MLAAAVDFRSPLFWAVFIGWVLSVVLHEFAHGLVAYLGGDYTIRERGGLTLNPLQYVDPVMSIILPMVFLAMGGIPLPGGATYIRTDLLRSRGWASAVAGAGPLMNLLLFVGLALSLNPRMGWVLPMTPVIDWTPAQKFVGALAFLELLSVVLNLVPVPPLDGFQIFAPYLSRDAREKLTRGPAAFGLFFLYFLLLQSAGFIEFAYGLMRPVAEWVGVPFYQLVQAFRLSLYSEA